MFVLKLFKNINIDTVFSINIVKLVFLFSLVSDFFFDGTGSIVFSFILFISNDRKKMDRVKCSIE